LPIVGNGQQRSGSSQAGQQLAREGHQKRETKAAGPLFDDDLSALTDRKFIVVGSFYLLHMSRL
jgi:hypothetical protein